MSETKDTNPKDAIGSKKLPLHLVPSTLVAYASLGFLEGALKYGKYNWRVAGVRASIYLDALKRHVEAWQNGEEVEPETGVPHLSSALACLGILVDAKENDKLVDDRPPPTPVGGLIRGLAGRVEALQQMFRDHAPTQWTIENAPTD